MTGASVGPVLDGHVAGAGPWVLAMRWTDLLFVHWRITPDEARALVPAPLEPDLFDGAGWLGVVPFLMSRVRPRLVPPVPPFSRFPELNVRTYARHRGRPGVWFLSLDAAGRLAVALGRAAAGLPYHLARMSMTALPDGWVEHRSERVGGEASAAFDGRYRPTGPIRPATPLEAFLTDRDGLWAMPRAGRPEWLAIRHAAWPLQDAELALRTQTMTAASGMPLTRPPDHLAFSRCLDVVAWRRMSGPAVAVGPPAGAVSRG
jgi:uncharacterized protein YqjF (DUF2071 family)